MVTITTGFLGNAAYREMATSAERKRWILMWQNSVFSEESQFFLQHYDGLDMSGSFSKNAYLPLTFDISIGGLHLVWSFGQPLGTWHALSQFRSTVIWTQIGTSSIQWFCLALEARQTPSSNKTTQDHMLHVVYLPSSIHRVFACSPVQNVSRSVTPISLLWIAKRLSPYPSPVNTVDKVRQ